ncbi:ABC transporter ATP-binding protein [Pseudomonas sp. DSP3-2-2]|uniref:ABC transporter ATP-binding protein n=1 Tax=unclassified Pseudomonas TaxID=196821 RepID=UPI003CF3404C
MYSDVIVSLKNVSKSFQTYDRPGDRLKQFLLPRFTSSERKYYREFWALKDISLDIHRGETIGIIGRNGAGKSTLLQIICGVLSASTGEVIVQGRIAALLELGAGFNADFTGRENVYLNGTVLGLSKAEIDSRFTEIEKFADIGEFIDQPVKSYSSGMYVRLAFAVQACIEPEILIVDEALAVGDVAFQYKCFKRMEQLKSRGVTIIMVTHSTGSILDYADRCIVVDGGRITIDTRDVLEAVLTYEKGMLNREASHETKANPGIIKKIKYNNFDLKKLQQAGRNLTLNEKRFGTARAIISRAHIIKSDGRCFSENPIIQCGEEITFCFEIFSSSDINDVVLGISLSKSQGSDIWGDNNINAAQPIHLKSGRQTIEYITKLPISPGDYLVHCGLSCQSEGTREELDQRRPMDQIKFWSVRNQVGVVFAPIKVIMDSDQ